VVRVVENHGYGVVRVVENHGHGVVRVVENHGFGVVRVVENHGYGVVRVVEKVSPHKWLRGGVHFVNSIAKSPSGKILRRVLLAEQLAAEQKAQAKL
jgi:acyl-coenzyme A synthetase/AMP-(fatty) acid ligase